MFFNSAVLLLCSILLLQDCTYSLRLMEVRIPEYVVKGSTAQLECLYDLDGESLYSVKWYKDGNEFYRYVPRDMPPAQTFLLPGVSVDVHNSTDVYVTLREVNLQSAGRFRCEVSGEAPSFQTVTEHGDMVVVSLPDQGAPKITGGRPRYQIGDTVRINCTAGRSKPAVKLAWFINGEAAEPHQVRRYDTIISGRDGLETSVLGLQFRVDQHHFRNGDMKLKCVASLSTFYWRSNEESVEGDRPQKAPVLESRETVYASNSRADPVQANKTDSALTTIKPSTLILLIVMALITSSGCFEQLHLNGVEAMKMKRTRQNSTRLEEMNKKSSYEATKIDNKKITDILEITKDLVEEEVEYKNDDANDDDDDRNNTATATTTSQKIEKKKTPSSRLSQIHQAIRVLSKEMHFNKETPCLPIQMAKSTATTTSMHQHQQQHQHQCSDAFNVTTSVSSVEQMLENSCCAKMTSPTLSLLSLPSTTLSSISSLLLLAEQTSSSSSFCSPSSLSSSSSSSVVEACESLASR
ncbi:beaten path IIIc isoform X2 [Haematobia irritans]|uniref:beaten path IIIc isoform X2 n=1 Tax=Haematobia irritans TaxID=7368 RepID=UPI003F4F4D01